MITPDEVESLMRGVAKVVGPFIREQREALRKEFTELLAARDSRIAQLEQRQTQTDGQLLNQARENTDFRKTGDAHRRHLETIEKKLGQPHRGTS